MTAAKKKETEEKAKKPLKQKEAPQNTEKKEAKQKKKIPAGEKSAPVQENPSLLEKKVSEEKHVAHPAKVHAPHETKSAVLEHKTEAKREPAATHTTSHASIHTPAHVHAATHLQKAEVKHETEKETPHVKKEIIQPEINIGMIGHVDHGKTSLTKALTGKWCDTHSEEMKRGISIRLGYADVVFYKLKTNTGVVYSNKPEHSGKPAEVISKRVVSFVDAPGHETLMTTMLSGAALMNGAVLVIAANEACPQPRTIEHLMALKFAGVDKVVVAQNKIDLITKEQAIENHKAIRNFLDSYGYKDTPIIPTAANFDANIDSLIEAIETRIPTPKFDESKSLKMFVARSFDINKPGTKIKELKGAVIGGSIAQGVVKIGDEIELGPGLLGKTKTKVMSIAIDGGLISQARPGGLIAIGTDLDPSMAQNDRLRGQIAAKPGTIPAPVKELKLKINMFERMIEQNIKEKTFIKVTEPLVITIGTNTVIAFVTKTDPKQTILNLKNEVIAEKNEKVAISKNINGQWRLVAFGEVL